MKHIDFLLKPAVYGTHIEAFGVKKEMLMEQKIKLKICDKGFFIYIPVKPGVREKFTPFFEITLCKCK